MGSVKFCMPNAYILILTLTNQRPPVTEIGNSKLIFGISTPEIGENSKNKKNPSLKAL